MVLDGLRGLAAIAVVFYHYRYFFFPPGTIAEVDVAGILPLRELFKPVYAWGHFGVELFWMISGFVFAAVYYGREVTSRAFFINRLARLYPLHIVTLLLMVVVQYAAIREFGATLLVRNYDLKHFVLQLGLASDWVMGTGPSFNAPIWSVSVETGIYGLFWASRRWVPLRGLVGPMLVAAVLGAMPRDGSTLFFQCGFHFFVGAALCVIWRSFASMPGLLVAMGLGAVAIGAAGLTVLVGHVTRLTPLVMLPLVLGGIIMLHVASEDFAPGWLRRALGWLGDRSYSIYLVHFPLLMILTLILGSQTAVVAQHAWFLALYLTLVLAVAWPCYSLFEAPARDWLRSYARTRRVPQAKQAELPTLMRQERG